jgi:hypothetical protein
MMKITHTMKQSFTRLIFLHNHSVFGEGKWLTKSVSGTMLTMLFLRMLTFASTIRIVRRPRHVSALAVQLIFLKRRFNGH